MQANQDSDKAASTPALPFVLPESGEAMLTVQHVAGALGRSVSSVWDLTKKDPAFPQPVRDGERYTRFRLSDIRSYIAGCWRRFKIEPPCRSKFEPGLDAVRRTVVCG